MDSVLALICLAQMTSRDAGVTRERLDSAAARHASARVCPDGALQSDRIDRALLFLTNEKLICERDGRIRGAHIRIAEKALQDSCRPVIRRCRATRHAHRTRGPKSTPLLLVLR